VSLGKGWQFAYILVILRYKTDGNAFIHTKEQYIINISREKLNLFKMVTSQFLSFTLLLDINDVYDELRDYDLPI